MRLAGSYAGRLGLTAWRRKSTVLGVACGLLLLIYCLQYNTWHNAPPDKTLTDKPDDAADKSPPREAKQVHRGNVQFVQAGDGNAFPDDAAPPAPIAGQDAFLLKPAAELLSNSPSRDDIIGRRKSLELFNANSYHIQSNDVNQPRAAEVVTTPEQSYSNYDSQGLYQMGIPYVNLDSKHPYIPEHRLVHLDLKGAPPKVSFLKRLFPLVRQLGATGVLLEWEDMFPFTGTLAPISAGNCYTRAEVRDIVEAATNSDLEVIPLVQTFGHVEFALKHSEFSSLREVPDSPQALCPSLNASMTFVEQLIEQVMSAHAGSRFLHIGCDEVFQMGECPRCRNQMRETLFLSHVARVARHVRARYSANDGSPIMPIIWDDMLRHISTQSMDEFHIGDLVEPMVWVYAEDVYRFVPAMVWDKYGSVFPRVWAASAFKGAFGETLYIPNVKRHLENNLRWLEVMTSEAPKFKGGFRGIALTGWQRYDHFSVLCELLPASVPSLAVNLVATSNGFFNQSLKQPLYSTLGCSRTTASSDSVVNLNSDPFMWDKFSRCFFPGAPFFKLTYRLHSAEAEVRDYLKSVTKSKGWMTEFNVRHNFSSPLRVDELMSDHSRVYHTLASLVRASKEALDDVFDGFTIAEWVEQRLYPDLKVLDQIQRDSVALKGVRHWPRRPFAPLRDLHKLGLVLDGENATAQAAEK